MEMNEGTIEGKERELKIGNYINRVECFPSGRRVAISLVQIIAIGGGYVSAGDESNYSTLKYNDYSPIKLNEEWLHKLGFNGDFLPLNVSEPSCTAGLTKKVDISYQDSIFEIWFFEEDEDENNDYGCIPIKFNHIKYVHQLQNLYFALTGEELEIKK